MPFMTSKGCQDVIPNFDEAFRDLVIWHLNDWHGIYILRWNNIANACYKDKRVERFRRQGHKEIRRICDEVTPRAETFEL